MISHQRPTTEDHGSVLGDADMTEPRAAAELARHLMVDFTQMMTFADDPLILDAGDGVRVRDHVGRTYIDGLSGVLTSNLGHGIREIAEAVGDQAARLAFGAPTMATTTRALELVERLLTLVPPPYTTMKFLSGGSEAVESALKIARQYHRQTGHPGKYKIIGHYRGYHGGTGHALAASGWAHWKESYEPFAPGFLHLQTPDAGRAPFRVDSAEEAGRIYGKIAEETVLFEGPDTVAAIIIEPVMMSAGVVVPPASYLRALRALCYQHDILLIYDEVITGFGRTGTWFGAEHSGAWPDIFCCGKGMTGGYSPLSAVFMTDSVAAAFWGENDKRLQFHSGHTFGGNPVACAAAIAAIDYMQRHDVVGNAARLGRYLGDQLVELATRHPLLAGARGVGMLQALVLAGEQPYTYGGHITRNIGSAIAKDARSRGLLLRASPWFVALAPPLVATRGDIDEILDILDKSMGWAAERYGEVREPQDAPSGARIT